MKDLTKDPDKYQTFCLHAGDYVIYGLDETNWDIEYFNPGMRLFFSLLPTIGAIGDHEGMHPGSFDIDYEHAGDLFRKYWSNPLISDSPHFYYSFDYGPVHIVVLDQYTTDYNKGSTQYNWLEQDLANTTKRWKIVMFHQPAWSAYGYPDLETHTFPHENNETVQKDLTPLFEMYGVKVVIQGHNHYYARCEVNDIQYLTLGGGGALTYQPRTDHANVVKAFAEHHFSRFDISGDSMTVSVINIKGDITDIFTVSE